MCAPTSSDLRQGRLFGEIVETAVTPDKPLEASDGSWRTKIRRPPGRGWRVIHFTRDRRTQLLRRRPVIFIPRRAIRGGQGWRC